MPNNSRFTGYQPISEELRSILPKAPKGGTGRVGSFVSTGVTVEDSDSEKLTRIEDKLDKLNRRLDLIFGDNVLMHGRFTNLRTK